MKNFIIADEKFSTNSYLLASEFSVSSNCTTAIESYFLEKPSINLRASDEDGLVISTFIREIASKETLDIKELEKIILDWFYENKKFSTELTSNLKESIKYNIKNINKFSYQYFLEEINDLDITQKIEKDKFSNKFFIVFFRMIKRLKTLNTKFYLKKIMI